MKDGIHPEYHEITYVMTDGEQRKTRTTWGKAGDTMRLDVDSKSHPAYTGEAARLMQNDQLDKFSKKFGSFSVGTAKEAKKEEKKSA